MPSLRRLLLAAAAIGLAAAQCSDDVTINSNSDVSKLESCSKLDGKLTVGTAVTSVELPSTLNSITGDLEIIGATQLTSFDASGLKTIGGSFNLQGLTVLSTLSCPELVSVGDISWATLPALQSLSFTKEVSKARNVEITDTLLSSLNGINLRTCQRFNINNNRYLKLVTVQLEDVSEILVVDANGKDLNASFPNLVWANNITIRHAGDISFPVLEAVNNSAAFVNNTFASADLPELSKVGESLAFVSCSRLTKISADVLGEIGGTFQLANNTRLSTVDGFGALKVVGGAVDFSGVFTTVKLPQIDDVRGGFNLQSTQQIDCKPFEDLHSNGVIKGDGFVCASQKDVAESKTGGLGTGSKSGNGSKSGAGRIGVSIAAAIGAGMVALLL